ncbi:NAD(+)/NADH kinase [Clostridium sp.]|uniref:NAD(+)/NADH kinase n=1 Tax=Clostridium sp. TaxID=1506 RepID=UPI003F3796DA
MKNIAIAVNKSKDKTGDVAEDVKLKLKKEFPNANILIVSNLDIREYCIKRDFDLIVVLGGDGTILGVARDINGISDTPLLGINIGNLGFLSSVEISDLKSAAKKIREEKYTLQDRILLQCSLSTKDDEIEYKALNDIVVARGTLSRMVKFNVFIDGKRYYTFKGDGLIIATPTGSTAYSFSAGGPFVYPDVDVITVTPICAHTKGMQTIVLNSDSKIQISVDSGDEDVYITFDGQKAIRCNYESVINIYKSKQKAKIVLLEDYDYFKVLRTKILNNSKEYEGD